MFRKIGLLIVSTLLLAGVLLASVTPAIAAEPETAAAQAAVIYIISLQNADGGFPAFGADSAPGSTIDAVFAMTAVGPQPTTVTTEGNSPADYLATQAAEYSTDPGAAAKLAYGVAAMGLDPSDFGGVDLLAVLDDSFDVETGAYGLDLFDQAFFIMALHQTVGTIPGSAVEYVLSLQLEDGGWEFGEGFGSDSNTTALVLQVLLVAGVERGDAAVTAALGYFHTVQDVSGAFGFLAGAEPDANSTAFVIQALIAAREDIDAGGPWTPGGVTPLEALLTFQNPETGAFQFAGEDSPFATYQVVPGLVLAPFPGLKPLLLPGRETPVANPTMTVEPVETPEPADLPKVGTGASSDGSPWLAPLLLAAGLAAGGLAALGLGAGHRRYR